MNIAKETPEGSRTLAFFDKKTGRLIDINQEQKVGNNSHLIYSLNFMTTRAC
jgi:hypothetical protein